MECVGEPPPPPPIPLCPTLTTVHSQRTSWRDQTQGSPESLAFRKDIRGSQSSECLPSCSHTAPSSAKTFFSFNRKDDAFIFLQEPAGDFSKIKVNFFQGRTERIQLRETVTLDRQRTGTNCLWATTLDQWQLNVWLLSLSISLISVSDTSSWGATWKYSRIEKI